MKLYTVKLLRWHLSFALEHLLEAESITEKVCAMINVSNVLTRITTHIQRYRLRAPGSEWVNRKTKPN